MAKETIPVYVWERQSAERRRTEIWLELLYNCHGFFSTVATEFHNRLRYHWSDSMVYCLIFFPESMTKQKEEG